MKNRIVMIIFTILLIGAHLCLDQVTKKIAIDQLKGQGTVKVIGDIFVLTYAENTGAFLSFGADFPEIVRRILLIFMPMLILLALIVYMFLTKNLTVLKLLAFTALIGGGFGNIFDRLIAGKVVDFMNFGIGGLNSPLRTGILNFADLSVVVGIILLFIVTLKEEKTKKKNSEVPGKNTEEENTPSV